LTRTPLATLQHGAKSQPGRHQKDLPVLILSRSYLVKAHLPRKLFSSTAFVEIWLAGLEYTPGSGLNQDKYKK